MPKVRYNTTLKREMAERREAFGRIYEVRIEGKHPIVHGKELTFRGERGRFRFKWATPCEDDTFDLTVYGGTKRYQSYRTFNSSRLKAVHYKQKLR